MNKHNVIHNLPYHQPWLAGKSFYGLPAGRVKQANAELWQELHKYYPKCWPAAWAAYCAIQLYAVFTWSCLLTLATVLLFAIKYRTGKVVGKTLFVIYRYKADTLPYIFDCRVSKETSIEQQVDQDEKIPLYLAGNTFASLTYKLDNYETPLVLRDYTNTENDITPENAFVFFPQLSARNLLVSRDCPTFLDNFNRIACELHWFSKVILNLLQATHMLPFAVPVLGLVLWCFFAAISPLMIGFAFCNYLQTSVRHGFRRSKVQFKKKRVK